MSEQKYQKHIVKLTTEEREKLLQVVQTGTSPARSIQRANVLLASDENGKFTKPTDEIIGQRYNLHPQTVSEIRKQFCQEGLEAATTRKKRKTPPPPKITGDVEAKIIALACGQPPEGQTKWTLTLLADKSVELEYVNSICRESVRQVLKKRTSASSS